MNYLPWWAGALSLSALSVGFWLVHRKGLGVSATLERLLGWRDEVQLRKVELAVDAQSAAFEAAMIEATRKAFGDEVAEQGASAEPSAPAKKGEVEVRLHPSVRLTFILSIAIGGTIGGALLGGLSPSWSLGPAFSHFIPSSFQWVVLIAGGMLVGFGTRLSGGCTTGHGLVGCGRLQPSSLLATGAFFGTAVGVSFLFEAMMGGVTP